MTMAETVEDPHATSGRRVLVLGAAGNLGRRVAASALAANHRVTAFVRSRATLEERWRAPLPAAMRVVEGDVLDRARLGPAMRDCDVVVSCAGNAFDGDSFVQLFDAVASTAEAALGRGGRVWMLAGLAVLDIPGAGRRGLHLPGVPRAYRAHGVNLRRLQRSALAWTLACPGPMIPATDTTGRFALRASIDTVAVEPPGWLRFTPDIALALFLKSKVPTLTATYEDVAQVIVDRLFDDALAGHRVGFALPAGETLRKAGWRPGRRSAVE
ncbi:hypothetical protein DFR50_109171 [Roseiarcus fermentans]|uniref:NAD(P)-binding domain-containing protein n=1 Tax=Roseiarcus fermentans TaxID=1473586 RepID=A0A366FIK2_9HYPH|nr:NAD(P)H-binding protein [Roseiarcus fermentans]RBP14417.1 hypothetical protein DFR50_109171 [Roseiarcus fermentans]